MYGLRYRVESGTQGGGIRTKTCRNFSLEVWLLFALQGRGKPQTLNPKTLNPILVAQPQHDIIFSWSLGLTIKLSRLRFFV